MTASTSLPISRLPVPDVANLPDDIRARILAVQEKSGFADEGCLGAAAMVPCLR